MTKRIGGGVPQKLVDKLRSLERAIEKLERQEGSSRAEGASIEQTGSVVFSNNGAVATVHVNETGVLKQLVESTEGYIQDSLEDVTISTEPGAFLNYQDFYFLRTSLPHIKTLNISQADCLNDFDPSNPVEFEVPRDAMNGNTTLETIVLSESATSIARGAFSGCTGLRGDLVIPDSVTHIGKVAFGFWGTKFPHFSSLKLSKNLEVLEAGAFLRSEISGTVTLPESLRVIEGDWTYGGAFQSCHMDGLVFPEHGSLEIIGDNAFSGCSQAKGTLKLNEGIREIRKYAFQNCSSLEGDLALPSTVEEIGGGAFSDCASLTGTVRLPDALTSLGNSAFARCTGITGLEIGSGLIEIPGSAFNGCTELAGTLAIPSNVQKIGASAFQGCTALGGVTFAEGLETIDQNAFWGDSGLRGDIVMPQSLKIIGASAFNRVGADGKLVLADEMQEIGASAFTYSKFTGLQLPKKLQNMGSNAFAHCYDMATDDLVLPEGLEEVPDDAFMSCGSISGTCVIPASVRSIGKSALRLTGIERVEFADGLEEIRESAFQDCDALLSISGLPSTLKTLGKYAFLSCNSLGGDIVLPDGLTAIGDRLFSTTNISSLAYHGDGVSDWSSVLYQQQSISSLDLSGSAVSVLKWDSTCPDLTEVKLPETLTELAITNKASLEDIDLTGCKGLTNVTLKSCAIDFSAGKPREWLDSYTGAKDITAQRIKLYGQRGAVKQSVEVGGEFKDDFKLFTKNGTDLSTSDKWTAFRGANQMGVASDGWIQTNYLAKDYPIRRNPSFGAAVDTSAAGVRAITYTNSLIGHPSVYEALNYSVELTVGNAPVVPDDLTLSVCDWNGTAVKPQTGVTKYYLDAPATMSARLSNGSIPELVTWKVYADEEATQESSDVVRLTDDGRFETVGAGTAWIVAEAQLNGKTVTSAPTKFTVGRRSHGVNLAGARSKSYGNPDAAALGYTTTVSMNGYTVPLDVEYTRDAGEDIGTYQTYLYDPDDLGLADMERGTDAFWAAYKQAATKRFEEKNPNFSLNLTVPEAGASGNYTIKPVALSVGSITVSGKPYDATTECAVTSSSPFNGLKWDDAETLDHVCEASFVSPDVKYNDKGGAIAQDVVVTARLSGEEVKNYTIPAGVQDGVEKNGATWHVEDDGSFTLTVKKTATITPLTLTCYLNPRSKEYDGTKRAAYESPEAFADALVGLCEKDQEQIGSVTAEFADENVGSAKPVTLVSDKVALANYKLPELKASITPKALEVDGLVAQDKVYDGTTAAVLSGTPSVNAEAVLPGDDVSIDDDALAGEIEGTFADRNAGENKHVVVSTGFGLAGAGAGNYYLDTPDDVRASILPAPLTVKPTAEQSKAAGAVDPVFAYELYGVVAGDLTDDGSIPSGLLRGELGREPGEAVGAYAFTLGSLTSNGNYALTLASDAPTFSIRDVDATLASLSVDNGTFGTAFSPDLDTYTVYLPFGATSVPEVTAIPSSADATVVVTPAADLSGTTTVEVTAADGVTSKVYTIAYKVADALALSAVTIGVSTDGAADGVIAATARGGFGMYEYSLDGSSWQTSGSFRDLKGGTYTVYARDVQDHDNSARIEVELGVVENGAYVPAAPSTLEVAEGQSLVMPYSAESHSVKLFASGNDAGTDLFYHLEDLQGVGGNAGGADVIGDTLTVFEPGTYTACVHAVRDGVSSAGTQLQVEVTRANQVSATANATDCVVWGGNGGSVDVAATGGLGTYEYRLGSGAWQDSATFSHLTAGTYDIEVRDKADVANTTVLTVEVKQPDATDAAAVMAVRDMLASGEISLGDLSHVIEDLPLIGSYEYGRREVSITWSSSDETVIAPDGTVTRPAHVDDDGKLGEDAHVTLTATISVGDVSRSVTFEAVVPAEDHAFSSEWASDESSHWHECACGERAQEGEHTYGDWIVTKESTHVDEGSHERACTVCGHKQVEALPAQGHSFSDEWKHSETSHWHECSCGATSELASHTFGAWIVTKPATETESGLKERSCTVCGRTETAEVPVLPHTHVFGDWQHDAVAHWRECSCGEKAELSEHTYGDWIVTKEPTHAAAGSRERVCTVCGSKQVEAIPAAGHNFPEEWTSDEMSHWRECSCGERADQSEHEMGEWHVTKDPTELEKGEQRRSCTVCGHEEIAELPVKEHEHAFGDVWQHDATSHWHECACGEKADLGDHEYGSWEVVKEPTATEAGERRHTCSACGYSETASIPALGDSGAQGGEGETTKPKPEEPSPDTGDGTDPGAHKPGGLPATGDPVSGCLLAGIAAAGAALLNGGLLRIKRSKREG